MSISKFFWNILAPQLLKLRWKRIGLELFSQPEYKNKLSKLSIDIPKNEQCKIIITPIRSQGFSNIFEATIGKYFQENGYEVKLLRCGQFLKKCETKSHFNDSSMACSMCHKEFDVLEETFGLESISYSDLISEPEKVEIRNFVNNIDLKAVHEWKGINIRKEWHSALQRYYLSSNMFFNEKPQVAREFLYTVVTSIVAGLKLKEKGFTHLFTSHGIYSTWGGVISGFNAAGGNVTVWGRGYYRSGIITFKHESYLNGLKYYTREQFLPHLNKEKIETIKEYLDSRWTLTNDSDLVSYYDNKNIGGAKDPIILPKDKKIIGFFPNIPWDGQVFVATPNYGGLRDVIKSLLTYVESRNDVHVVIRPHPYENPAKNPNIGERFIDLAKEYHLDSHTDFTIIPYDSSITSYDLAEKSQVNVLLAGTIGLEFAARGLPVIQLGANIASGKGIFFEPKDYEQLANFLNKLLADEHSDSFFDRPETIKNALEWATFFFEQTHTPDLFYFNKGTKITEVKKHEEIDFELLSSYLKFILNGEQLFFRAN